MKRSLQNLIFQNKTTWKLGVLFLFMACLPIQSIAQTKEYASGQANGTNGIPLLASVSNPNGVVGSNESTYAELKSNLINILGIQTSGQAWIQMNFNNPIAINSTTYVKVDDPTTEGLNLDLLATLGGLLGILESDLLDIEVYNGPSLLNSSEFSTSIVEDLNGQSYIAITPTKVYTGVRVKLKYVGNLLGVALGSGIKFKIYGAFHYTSAPACGKPLHTYYEESGLNIGLLEFQNRNLNRAIDADANTFSLLKQGALLGVNVAGSLSQVFNFESSSNLESTVNIKLSLGSGGLINTDLLGSAEVVFYNKGIEVYKRSLQSGLLNNTDALGLLQSGQPITVTFAPSRAFDRVGVRLTSPVGLSVAGSALQIYDVQRFDDAAGCSNPEIAALPAPTANPFETPSCANGLVDFDNVDFAHRAVDGNNESFATLYADSGSLLVSGPTAGFVEMDLGQTLPANRTTYVRINYDEDVLDALLGGSLGKLVGDLVNNLLLGNQYFEVEAKNGASSVLSRTSTNAFEGASNGAVTLVKDGIGRYYIAITPDAAYNRIRITNHVAALLPTGKKATLDVYNACFEMGTDSCFPANFTSYRGGGIGLSAANISSVGVTDAYKTISEDSSGYSKINLGVAGLLSHVYQTIYFSQPSQTEDKVKIRLAIEPSSALSLDVLGQYKIKFFNGNTQVGTDASLQGGLLNNIDLLALFKSGGIIELEYEPVGIFDRVEIGAESIVSINVAAEPLRVYSVKRYGASCPLSIGATPFIAPSCATLLVDASNADDVQNLFDEDFDSHATLNSGAGILLGLGNKYEGFVELGYDQPVAAGTTSYIRIDFVSGILENLISGSLGNVVSGLLDGLVLGDHFFKVEVKDATGTIIDQASSNEASAGGNNTIRIVKDKQGRFYIAVTPTADYKSVRITDATDSTLGLLAPPNTMNVYGMCHETSLDSCMEAFATSYEFSGLNLSVNDLSGAGVSNAEFALNENSNQGSLISNGTLGIGTSTKQWIFFNKVSDAQETVNIFFKTQAGAVNVDLLGGLEIKAYLGNTEVMTLDWQNGIVNGVNVLSLLSNDQVVNLPFTPGANFDRISVGIATIVGVSVFPPLELLSVSLCADSHLTWKSYKVNDDASITSVKGGEEVTYTIHIENKGSTDMVDFIVEDVIPEYTTYVDNSGGTYDPNTNTVSFNSIAIAAGTVQTVSFKVLVKTDLTGVVKLNNIAIVKEDANDVGQQTYPPLDNTNPIAADTNAVPGTDIPVDQISSVVSWKAYDVDGNKATTAVSGGEDVAYYIYVRNTGNQNLTSVTVSDVLPAGLTWKTGGTHAGGTVTFTIPTLAVGATSSALNFVATVDENVTGLTEIKNIAVVKVEPTDPGTESFPPVDNTTIPTEPDTTKAPGTVLEVTPIHEVEFSKVGVSNNATNNAQAQVGDQITYTITVKNIGNTDLSNVSITDVLPANLTILNNGGGATTAVLNELVFTSVDLAVGDTETFTIVVSVDDLDGGITEIVNTANVKFRNEANTGDKTATATHTMPTSCTPILANQIILTPTSLTVCAAESFSITASTSLVGLQNPVYSWYTNAALTGTPFVGEVLTTSVTQTTTFYVSLEADGYCFSTPAATLTVTVEAEAGIPTITAAGGETSTCEGTAITLTATATPADSYQWYKDGVEITGAINETFDATETGAYTATALNATGCDSNKSAAIEITIYDIPTKPTITPDGTVEICEGEFVKLTASAGVLYEWYHNGTLIEFPTELDPAITETRTNRQSVNVNESGAYTVKVFNAEGCASDFSESTIVTVNPAPVLTVTGSQMIYAATGTTVNWPVVTSDIGTVVWYDSNGNDITGSLPTSFANVGVFTYSVAAIHNGCYSFETIIVNVYDADACPPGMERVYANNQSWGSIITGGVSNRPNAVDGNPKTYSTITTGVGLLGIGTTWQNLYFNNRGEAPVPAGTPVTIKLGKEYSGLALAGGLSVVGIKRDALGTPIDIGVLKPVAGGLLDLLAADNVVEFTFVPSNASGTKAFDGIRISLGALLSVAQNAKVYGAYYTKPGNASCDSIDSTTNPNVIDVLHGVKDLGLGVASSTASVVTPWNAVDNDLNTSAKLVRGVSVLNAATLTVIFKQPVQPTDEIGILIKDITNNGLNLDLLTGYQFQRYMGDTPVGAPIQGGDVLNLKLLYFSQDKRTLMIGSFAEPYDRIMIAVGSIVQVALSDQMEIFDVSVTPAIDYGQVDGEIFEICAGEDLKLQMQDDCTFYEVYDVNDTLLDTAAGDSFSFIIPQNTPSGEQKFYVQAIRDGCPIGSRQEIKVIINDVPVLDGLEIDGTASVFQTAINVSPNDVVAVKPIVNWGTSTELLQVWEMENPGVPGEWIVIPFAVTEMDGTLKLTIPAFGEVTLPNGSVIDIRNTEINIRLTLESKEGCQTIEDGLILKIDGKSQLISNPNITNKLKN